MVDGDGGTESPSPPPDVGIPGYTVFGELGRGGFGVVYQAHQSDVQRVVAIKVLTGSLDEHARRRFEREREAMGLLSSHPHCVTVHGSGFTASGYPYIVMEHLEGRSLGDRLDEGTVGWEEAVQIGVKLAGALVAAHDAGVLHRDVKPDNVLVSSYGEPKLADFGIARLEGGAETRSGVITASLFHAAPEVFEGRRPTTASDVYSLTSTVFALIAGHPPFVRDTDESLVPLFLRVTTEPVPDLRGAGVPDAVCRVLEDGMAKDPSSRIASAEELGRRFQEAQRASGLEATPMVVGPSRPPGAARGPLDDAQRTGRVTPPPVELGRWPGSTGEPVAAPAAGGGPPPRRPSQRRRGRAVVAGVVVLVVAVGALGAVLYATRDRGGDAGRTTAGPADPQCATARATGGSELAAGRWHVDDLGEPVGTRPVALGDVVVVGGARGTVAGYEVATGERRFSEPVPGAVFRSEPGHSDDTAFLGSDSDEGGVYAVGAVGAVERVGDLSDPIAGVMHHEGRLYVGRATSDGGLAVVDSDGGSVIRVIETGGAVFGAPVLHEGRAYFASTDGTVFAVSTVDLEVERTWDVGGRVEAGVAVDSENVYVATTSGRVVALPLEGDEPAWEFAVPRPNADVDPGIYAAPAAVPVLGLVFAGSASCDLYALRTGAVVNEQHLGGGVTVAPIVPGLAWVGDTAGDVDGIDPVSGQATAFVDICPDDGETMCATPAAVTGLSFDPSSSRLFVATAEGTLTSVVAGS